MKQLPRFARDFYTPTHENARVGDPGGTRVGRRVNASTLGSAPSTFRKREKRSYRLRLLLDFKLMCLE